jgi:nucleoside-diphosphate kinase
MKLTYAMIKPDAFKAKNVGNIISRIEKEGFNIIGLKLGVMERELAEEFYSVHKDKPFFSELVDFIISGPVVALVLEKENAIKVWRDLMGNTDPAKADENTLRKLYGTSIGPNALHGSDAPETAVTEINLIFPELMEEEIVEKKIKETIEEETKETAEEISDKK